MIIAVNFPIYAIGKKKPAVREMSICSKLGPYLSEMEFKVFVRIQKVIWDHLLASKAEIIQKLAFYNLNVTKATN